MAKLALFTLFTLLLSTSHLSSALQVTPNSPCSSACRDSLDLDASDPNSSNTKNSDITCPDAGYSSPAGTKFKTCMTCLQSSTFSQGSESDTMWFLCTSPGSKNPPDPAADPQTRQPEVHGCLLPLRLSQRHRHRVESVCDQQGLRSSPGQLAARHSAAREHDRLLVLRGRRWRRHGLCQL